jgi:tyrosine-protein kinase Etk/Wzc
MTQKTIPDQKSQSGWDDSHEDEISLIDLAIVLAKHKKLILGAPLITAVIVALISLLIPNSYTATTQMLPPQQQSGAASALLGQLGALSSLAGVSAGIKNPNDTYVAMLKSRTVSDNLIRRFKLQTVYDKKYSSDTRKKLEKASAITAGKDGVIVVKVDDREPKRAAALANGYVEELQKLTKVLAVTEASQRRLFFETQLLQAKQALGDAEISLKQLQEKTGLIQLDAQAEALVKAGSELKAQIAMKEVEIGAMRTFATGNNPDYIRIEQLLGGLRSQLAKVEAGYVTARKIPEAGLEYVRKVRDLKYAETVYELLAKQFEIAKIDEAKEGSMIQVLDRAVVPDKKSNPKRSLMVALATLAVGFCAVLWAFVVEGLNRAKEDADNAARLAKFRQLLQWK